MASFPAQTWRRNNASITFDASISFATTARSDWESDDRSAPIWVGANRAVISTSFVLLGTDTSCAPARITREAQTTATTTTHPRHRPLIAVQWTPRDMWRAAGSAPRRRIA